MFDASVAADVQAPHLQRLAGGLLMLQPAHNTIPAQVLLKKVASCSQTNGKVTLGPIFTRYSIQFDAKGTFCQGHLRAQPRPKSVLGTLPGTDLS